MLLQLTPELLRFLTVQGFKYCLSKTTLSSDEQQVYITLTPSRSKPRTRKLPEGCDTYFAMSREPVQMADGVDETLILVSLNRDQAIDYLKTALKPVIGKSSKITLALARKDVLNPVHSDGRGSLHKV